MGEEQVGQDSGDGQMWMIARGSAERRTGGNVESLVCSSHAEIT